MRRLGDFLVQAGLVTEAQIQNACQVSNFAGGRLGTLLLERGAISEEDLGKALAAQHRCEYIPWAILSEVPSSTVAVLPARFALKNFAVPYEVGNNFVKLALRDPSDLGVVDELFFVIGKRVLAGVAPEVRIHQALEKYYGKLRAPRFAILADKLSRPRGSAPPLPAEPAPEMNLMDLPAPPGFSLGEVLEGPAAAVASAFSLNAPPVPAATPIPEARERVPGWVSLLATHSPASAREEPEMLSWEDPGDLRPREEPEPPPKEEEPEPPPPPMEEPPSSPPMEEPPSPPQPPFAAAVAEVRFPEVRAAADRDSVARAVLSALRLRFPRAALFGVRKEAVHGWACTGDGIDAVELRSVLIPWSLPSVFLNVRLSRAPYVGPLPPLAAHAPLSVALGGWPPVCLVQPVLIRETPAAFFYVEPASPGAPNPQDMVLLRDLAQAAAAALANAIRLRKKDI